MKFVTDRKPALGIGSAKSGTEHFREMKRSSVALLFLIPFFVFTFGSVIGESHDVVVAYFAKPFPALVTAFTIVIGFGHFKSGAAVLIGDYVHGTTSNLLIVSVNCLSYVAMAIGLFALIKMSF